VHASSFPIGAAATLEELDRDPHPLHARLRAQEPVSWLPALDGWLVTSRDLALQAMRDAETFTVDDPRFSTGQVVGPSMLTLDGSEHARHRGPFARPFRLDAVRERFTAVVEEETDRLLDGLEPEGRAELRRGLAGPLAARIVTFALGLPDEDTGAVLGWYDRIVAAVTEVTEGRPVPASGREAFAALRASVEPAFEGDAGDLTRD
jgi:cytochrome P450